MTGRPGALQNIAGKTFDVCVIRGGAAYVAGLAVGFKDIEELRTRWAVDQTWAPATEEAKRDELYQLWKKAVTRSFDWVD